MTVAKNQLLGVAKYQLNGKIGSKVANSQPQKTREGRTKKVAYKTEKLEARIKEKFGTQAAFAEALGLSKSTVSRYLSTGRDWKGSTLIKAIRLLEIPEDQIDVYFFESRVAKSHNSEVAK